MGTRISEHLTSDVNTRPSGAPSWAGKRVGRFRLMSELGRGAMGRVIRAEDTLLHRQVALKVLPKVVRRGNRTIAIDRLIGEARAAATLDHPNVVTVYEINESGGVYYIAMELLEGGSLRDIVKAHGPMDSTRACLMCADAADALAQAHALGIIHRDVKPANLMLTRAGRCKVADFGLARMEDAGDLSSTLPESVGTPQFIAPELLRGVLASARSDIYSLGATLWYLLTGHPPFEAATAADLLRQHLETPLPDLSALRPDLPEGLVQAVNRAMAKRPADRFESAAQFEKVLRVYTIAESSTAQSLSALMTVTEPLGAQPTFVPAPPAWRPSKGMAIGAAAGVVVLVVGIILGLKALQPPARATSSEHSGQLIAAANARPAPTRSDTPESAQAVESARQAAQVASPAPQPAPQPEDARAIAARAKDDARRGRFAQAAAEYASALKIDPADAWNWYYRAALAAYLGEDDVYRATCQGMFRQFAGDVSTQIRDRTAKTCCLLPSSGVDPKALVALANTLPDDGGGNPDLKSWFVLCKGVALYRYGQYQRSIELLQQVQPPERVTRFATARLFQAMAQWRSGMRDEAQSTLRDATDRIDRSVAKAGVDEIEADIENWLICQVMRRQAEQMILH